jgi:hypothetical protein
MPTKTNTKPELALEEIEHYKALAQKLVSPLTLEERAQLQSKPLGSCPQDASIYYQEVHRGLKNGYSEKANGAELIYAKFLLSTLEQKTIVDMPVI